MQNQAKIGSFMIALKRVGNALQILILKSKNIIDLFIIWLFVLFLQKSHNIPTGYLSNHTHYIKAPNYMHNYASSSVSAYFFKFIYFLGKCVRETQTRNLYLGCIKHINVTLCKNEITTTLYYVLTKL